MRVDKNLKDDADKLFKELGMNTSIAVNIFLTQCVREQSIPFNVSKEEKPNERLRKTLQESEDILSGKVKAKKYDKFEDVLKDKDNDI